MMRAKYSGFSPEHIKFLKKQRNKKIIVHAVQAGILILFVGVWELLAQVGAIDTFFVSSPSRVWNTIMTFEHNGSLLHHAWVSTYETLLGFVLGTALGYLIAVILWWNEYLQRIFEPYLVVLNSLPKIALGPLIILWVGTGRPAIITMTLLISVIITTISLLSGFVETDKSKILLMQSMHASRFQIFTKLVAPSNVPILMSTLKINVGMSWVGAIMGEYLSSKEGLGNLLVYGSQTFQMDLVMTCIIVLCTLAGIMYALVSLAGKFVVKNRW